MKYKRVFTASWILLLFCSAPSQQTNPSLTIDGDIILGGLVPVHAAGNNTPCGHINERLGIQRLEAMLYAVDQVNKNTSLLGNVKLGLEVYDTCSSETVALDSTLNFIHGHLSKIDQGTLCKTCGSDRSVVVGVVGALYSTVSTQVARLLRLFQIPQVSYDSTSYELSDKTRFEYFSRTVPHDMYQAKAIADIVHYFNWTFISVVYSDDIYGNQGLLALKAASAKMGICIGALQKVDLFLTRHQYLNVIDNLLQQPNARCVVVFCSKEAQIANLMYAARSKGVHKDLQWIGTDAWGTIVWMDKLKEVAENAITVQPRVVQLDEFEEYYNKLKPGQNSRNQWFDEFWENHFECYLNDSTKQFQRNCNVSDRLSSSNNQLDMRVASTMDAIFTFAHALDKLHKTRCPHTKNMCNALRNISGKELLANLRNISFVGTTGFKVRFDENGDMGGAYEVNIFRKRNDRWSNVMIGEWNHGLSINPLALQGNSQNFNVVESHCTPHCGRGQYKVPVKGKESCCWTCEPCNGNSYVINGSYCRECPLGQWPLANGKGCREIHRSYFGVDYRLSGPTMAFSCFGIILTFFVISVLIKFNNTPVVKACGRELSHLLLIGIILCFVGTFITVIKPNNWTCVARFFSDSLPFTLCYAALFIKTNRISRIFNRKNLVKRPIFILPTSQLFLVVAVVSVQVLILAMLTVISIPKAKEFYSKNKFVYLDCSISALDFGLSQVYNFILILMCTVYAFKTRKSPSNFNEAKCIAFAMYSSCVVWFAFLAMLYMQTTPEYKPAIICVSVSLVAYILLGFLYGSKVYIVLFKPHRNVRKPTVSSVSLSSVPQSNITKTRKNSYMGFHGDNGEESSQSTLDRKRTSCDFARRSFSVVPDEMERLVSQLKKELHVTKQALKSAQEQLSDFEKLKTNAKNTNKENWFDGIPSEKLNNTDEKIEKAQPSDNKEESVARKGNICALHALYLNRSADLFVTDHSSENSDSSPTDCSVMEPILGHLNNSQTRRSNSVPSNIDYSSASSHEETASCRCKRAKLPRKQGRLLIPSLNRPRNGRTRAPRPHSKSRLITDI